MPGADYGPAERLLHRLALGVRPIAEMSLDLELARTRPDGAAVRDGAHLFIAGLARAGTTILLRRIHAGGGFGSLTYADMPFVLAPGLWARLSRRVRRPIAPHERAHGDGIMVDADSPENLDEVFWRIYCGQRYLRPDALVPHDADAALLALFRRYVAAILQSRAGRPARYLSKTNNSILRIGLLRQAFPAAQILVPFRQPEAHAASLLAQHLRFCAQAAEDPFVRRYMGWLGHHEFGPDHRPFVPEGRRPVGSPQQPDYWLSLWCNVYQYLLDRHADDVLFVSYDRLCTDPALWPRLAARCELGEAQDQEPLRHVTHPPDPRLDGALRERAQALHARLLRRAL